MAVNAIRQLLRRFKVAVLNEGLISLTHKVLYVIIGGRLFDIVYGKNVYLYVKDTSNNIILTPKIKNYTLKIISTSKTLKILIENDFDFHETSSMDQDTSNIERYLEMLDNGGIMLCIFVDKVLAHENWVFLKTSESPDPYFRDMNYADGAVIGPCNTYPQFRGAGLCPYVLTQICDFLKIKEKSKALISTTKNNFASRRCISKAGFKVFREFRLGDNGNLTTQVDHRVKNEK